jgi:cytochrome c553
VNLMHAVVDRLGPADARDLAEYYASLGARSVDTPPVAP